MEQAQSQLKLECEIVTGTQAVALKSSPGSAVDFEWVNKDISDKGCQELWIHTKVSQ
jgi:hypothetical protein